MKHLACLLLLLASPVHATTMELYGFGARLNALGNTGEAVADDFYATYANPANLALRPHIHLGMGGDYVVNHFAIDTQGQDPKHPVVLPQDNFLLHLGVSSPLPGWLEDKASVGVALHLPISSDTRLESHDHRQPQVTMYDTLGDRLALVFGLGVRPLKWLAVGVSAQLLTTLGGSADLDLSVLDHRITRKHLDVELLTKPYPIVGVTLLPHDDVRVALVWRARSEVRYALPLTVDIEELGVLRFAIAGGGLFLPDVFALAGSVRRGRWLGTAGVAWLRWSQLPPLASDVRLDLDDSHLKQGTAPDHLLKAANVPIDLGAQDILQPRAGLEWHVADAVVLRGGVQYRPTPLPKADGPANYLDAPATTLSLGVGLRTEDPTHVHAKPLQVDLALQSTLLSTRTVQKLDPNDPFHATSLSGASWHVALGIHHDF